MRTMILNQLILALSIHTIAIDGQDMPINGKTTQDLAFDTTSDTIVVVLKDEKLPEHFVRLIDAKRLEDKSIAYKLEKKPSLAYGQELMDRILTALDVYLADCTQFATRTFGQLVDPNRGINWTTYRGFKVANTDKWIVTDLGRVCIEFSSENKYSVLAEGRLARVDFAQFVAFATRPSIARLAKLVENGVPVDPGYVLTRSVKEISAIATNGQNTIFFDRKLEGTKVETKNFIPMAAINVDGNPVKGEVTVVKFDKSDIVVDANIDPMPLKGTNQAFERFAAQA